MNVQNYSWDEFFKDAKLLAKKVKGNNFTALLVITKGGLPLGSYLSQALSIDFVETISIKTYDTEYKKDILQVIKKAQGNLPAKLLIVDDISDSGDTLKFVQEQYKAPTVTLFKKKGTKTQPTFCLHEVDDDVWVKFPWEEVKV